jgi:hypothetical protein
VTGNIFYKKRSFFTQSYTEKTRFFTFFSKIVFLRHTPPYLKNRQKGPFFSMCFVPKSQNRQGGGQKCATRVRLKTFQEKCRFLKDPVFDVFWTSQNLTFLTKLGNFLETSQLFSNLFFFNKKHFFQLRYFLNSNSAFSQHSQFISFLVRSHML